MWKKKKRKKRNVEDLIRKSNINWAGFYKRKKSRRNGENAILT